jgi:uncharacterized repeat protein (TIGR01451 family)
VTGRGSDDATFRVRPSPFLDLDKSVDPEFEVGYDQPITYTVVADNTGPEDAQGFSLADALHPSTSFSSWILRPAAARVEGNLITWSGTLTASQAVTLVFVADQEAGYGATVTNTATFSHTTARGSAAAEFHLAQPPVLTLTKEITPQGLVGYHKPVTFEISLANGSGRDAIGVVLRDGFPAQTTFGHWIAKPYGASVAGDAVSWTGTVTASTVITLAFSLSQTAPYNSKVTNVVTYALASTTGQAQASFSVESRFKEKIYLPIIFRKGDPFEPDPPPETGCPCGWFDSLGRMMDFWPGDPNDP